MRDVYINEVANVKFGKFFKNLVGDIWDAGKKVVGGILKDPTSLATIFVPGANPWLTAASIIFGGGKGKKRQYDPLQILAQIQAQAAMERWERYGKKMMGLGEGLINEARAFLPTIRQSHDIIYQQVLPTYQVMMGTRPLSQQMEEVARWIFG